MSCIVGLVENGRAIMGADTLGSAGYKMTTLKEPKIFRKGKFLFGACGSIRMMQIVKHVFKPPPMKHKDLVEYLCSDFSDKLRKTFKDSDYELHSEEGNQVAGHLLVGYGKRIFFIESNFQIIEAGDGIYAIGSGEEFAYGALHILKDIDISTEEKVRRALEASARFCSSVGAPFVVEEV